MMSSDSFLRPSRLCVVLLCSFLSHSRRLSPVAEILVDRPVFFVNFLIASSYLFAVSLSFLLPVFPKIASLFAGHLSCGRWVRFTFDPGGPNSSEATGFISCKVDRLALISMSFSHLCSLCLARMRFPNKNTVFRYRKCLSDPKI